MENKKNILIIILVIIIAILCVIIGWILGSKYANLENESLGDSNNNINDNTSINSENNDTQLENNYVELKNYNVNEIKSIEVNMPVKDSPDLEMKSVLIEDKEEMKKVLLNVDEAKEIGQIPYGIGFESNITITVNYDADPSTVIIILDNGDIVINQALGAGETGYAKYEISNKNFATELISKYQN